MTLIITMTDVEQTADLADLVDGAMRGSREAFAELVQRHHHAVRAYLSRFVRSLDDADDLAQEVFLTAFRGLEDFDFSRSFVGWLMGIAKHRALHHLRTESRRRRRETNSLQIALAKIRLQQAEQYHAVNNLQETQALRACLEELPKNSRKLIKEFYFDDCKAADIARVRGVKDGTIRMTLLRIRRALADCMQRRIGMREPPL